MKIIPPTCPEPEVGPKYWRSLDQLAETPEFNQWVEREFPAGASEFNDPLSRRHFVKIMSASFLLGGLGFTGCRRPEEHILPFSKMPEGYIHGVAHFYATARPTRGSAVPLLVKSHDGRPTKIEGNPNAPESNGGTDAFTQASILNLYDPDRAMRFTHGGSEKSTAEAFDALAEIAQKFQATSGEGLSFLLEQSSSPSRERLQKLIAEKFPKARWFSFEPVDLNVERQAAALSFGQAVAPEYRLEKARRILSLDCDFLGAEEDSFRSIRSYAKGRKLESPSDDMNRLYVVESLFSVTGMNADHRLRVQPSQIPALAARLASEILKGGNLPGLAELGALFKGDEKWIAETAKDLVQHGKGSVVLAGHRQPLAVHLIAHAINGALGSLGDAVVLRSISKSTDGSISDLAKSLNAGEVDTLVVLGGNQAYTAPTDLNWSVAQAKAKTVVRLGYYEDESFAGATWHLPAAHFLESWGDARTADGTVLSIQPLIEPLFNGVTEIEVLSRIGGLKTTRPLDIVRETFKMVSGLDAFDEAWKKFLHDGYLANSAAKPVDAKANLQAIGQYFSPAKPSEEVAQNTTGAGILSDPAFLKTIRDLEKRKLAEGGYEIVFHRDYSVDDGRYNNNGWLQELPDPITKVVWENVIMVSPATAKALDLQVIKNRTQNDLKNNDLGVTENNDILEVELNGGKIQGPVWIQPGQADNTIALALGYGRWKTGRVGTGAGYNAYNLRTSETPWYATGAKVRKTGGVRRVVSTQEHGSMEGRPIVREANIEQFKAKPDFAHHMDLDSHVPNAGPIYQHPYNSHPALKSDVHQWGMSIDMNSCVGCNACVVACQSENNIPIVGKDQVNKGREMHWMRIDRYYTGEISDPQVANQPMLCQHCESAPCESVCPVNATVHDEEGLNIMAYNRCVGTRYCGNNCAWKVRRFNFFDFNKRPNDLADMSKGARGKLYQGPLAKREPLEYDLIKMMKNPDVTVRMRGVMEKCSFCIQRIEGAKISQKVKAGASDNVRVPEGTFTTACAQVCPAEAIVFGNILDENSRVAKLKKQERNYAVLGFLDTKPRLTYLARIRNPNPAMPDYKQYPASFEEYETSNGASGEHESSPEMKHSEPAEKGAH
ncbi:MAG: TAT-variant-translocated molybdopterin oxidoreductase [Verrucomicrobiota bacterium]